jgi:hypothetical protein
LGRWASCEAKTFGTAYSLERVGAGDDLDELLGDRGLARAVVGEGQPVDHLAGVLGRRLHRGHARGVLGGLRLEQHAVDLEGHVAREELLEDLLGRGLEE